MISLRAASRPVRPSGDVRRSRKSSASGRRWSECSASSDRPAGRRVDGWHCTTLSASLSASLLPSASRSARSWSCRTRRARPRARGGSAAPAACGPRHSLPSGCRRQGGLGRPWRWPPWPAHGHKSRPDAALGPGRVSAGPAWAWRCLGGEMRLPDHACDGEQQPDRQRHPPAAADRVAEQDDRDEPRDVLGAQEYGGHAGDRAQDEGPRIQEVERPRSVLIMSVRVGG